MNRAEYLPAFPPEPDLGAVEFGEAYDLYADARNRLIAAEQGDGEAVETFLHATTNARELVARASLAMYAGSSSIADFDAKVRDALEKHPAVIEDGMRMGNIDPILGTYMVPVSENQDYIPTAVESILGTSRNLEIVRTFAEVASSTVDGMLLSGANSWGAFFAVKAGLPDRLVGTGYPQLDYKEFSDIDMLVTAEETEVFGETVSNMIDEGLLSSEEKFRFGAFQRLYEEGKVDMFSVRSHYGGVEQSLHFVPYDLVQRVVQIEPVRPFVHDDGQPVNIVKDFRPDVPGNVRKFGGYKMSDLRGIRDILVTVQLEEVHDTGSKSLGYISENTVGGRAVIDGQDTYSLGVLGFFLGIHPIVVCERDRQLSGAINTFHANIADVMDGDKPKYITRQERMPSYTLSHVINSLS